MNQDVQIIAENIELSQLQKTLAAPTLNQMFIDVRTPEEYNLGHIPGFLNFPLDHIEDFMGEFTGKDVILSCKSGVRARQVAQTLHAEGHVASLTEFSGGFKAWEAEGLPVESEVSNPGAKIERDYHPDLKPEQIHNGDNTLSKVKTNITKAAGTVSHQVFDHAKETFSGIESQFVALPPLRQVYAIVGVLMLIAAIVGGVFGVLLNLMVALALIFSSITGIMFLTDWVQKAPWNKRK